MKENMKQIVNGTTIAVFIVAFLLGYGFSARVVNRAPGGAEQAAEEAGESAKIGSADSLAVVSEAVMAGDAVVSVDDQAAGMSVAVAVKAPKAVWAAVHEEMDGVPGKILGAQLFSVGSRTGAIDLLRATEAGKKYAVMLHEDDGDGAFDWQRDVSVRDEGGNPVSRNFTAIAKQAATQ